MSTNNESTEDKSGSNILTTLSVLPILWALFLDSNSAMPPIAFLWFAVACMAFSIFWLLFTRCKFATVQVLLALILTSLELMFIAQHYPLNHRDNVLLLGCAPLLSFVGLFIGIRLTGSPDSRSRRSYWFRFLFGLLLPVLIPGLIAGVIFLTLYIQHRP